MARDIRARDSTIKEIAEKLSETAEAAEAAASAAYTMDEQRRIACAEIERLRKDSELQMQASARRVYTILLVHFILLYYSDRMCLL